VRTVVSARGSEVRARRVHAPLSGKGVLRVNIHHASTKTAELVGQGRGNGGGHAELCLTASRRAHQLAERSH